MYKLCFLAVVIVAVVPLDASVLKVSFDPMQTDPSSCRGRCNQTGTVPVPGCQCNTRCVDFNDCCADYYTLCLPQSEGSCAGKCGAALVPSAPCQCNTQCQTFGDCCPDYVELCDGSAAPITNAELEALGEELFALEGANNAASLISWNLQTQTTQGSNQDVAPLPLLTVEPAAYNKPTIALFVALLDNYLASVSTPENVTPQETAEEEAFIDAVLATPIMVHLSGFLASKNVAFSREKFRQMWFELYTRSSPTLGSTGFEHVFLAELKSGVSGFHNWVFFAKQEEAELLNYYGWMKFASFGEKGGLIQHKFNWLQNSKPISSMFVGTSPEFELAVYTVCWLVRPDSSSCPMSFGGVNVKITTYTIGSSKQFVATAYADPL